MVRNCFVFVDRLLVNVRHSALAVDMTARNLQEVVKKKGLPWSAVKGFDTFTPIGYKIF
jgi:2-keto-4-pentenoate hydratase/2-oxohepta-3-ene-1,7-dioic acid hydratase in catechol pathway